MKGMPLKALARRVLRAARSPRCREDVARAAMVIVLLTPILLLAADHHGAERLPTHAHAAPAGRTVSAHLHSFEMPHVDGVHTPVSVGAPVVVAPQPVAV